jgi:hypothetical protein
MAVEVLAMYRPVLLLVTALLGLASLLLTGLAMSIPNRSAEANDPLPAEQTVRRFYDAVNLQIRTGDPSALRDVLHPDFADEHPLPGFAPGSEGLIEHVATLHAGAPAMAIAIESIVASGEEALATVSVQDPGTRVIQGFEVQSAPPVWSTLERFRIEGGRIIERSSASRDLIVIQERFDLPLQLEADHQVAYLATLWTVDASASTRYQTSGGPAVLHVLSGEVALTVISDASASGMQPPMVHEPGSEGPNPVAVDGVMRLTQSSTVTFPEGVGFAVTTSDAPASVLYVSRERISPLGPGSEAGSSESESADARYLGAMLFDLAFEPSLTARLHRIVLMPGAMVTALGAPDASQVLMWLEMGSVLTEHFRPPESGAGTVNNNRQFVSGVQLTPDDRLAYLWEAGATLHNTSHEPAVLWVLSAEVPAN